MRCRVHLGAPHRASTLRRLRIPRVLGELADALLQGREGPVVAGGPQAGDVGFGEALVLAAERFGERDIPDLAAAEPGDRDPGDVVETAAGPRADVEDALLGGPVGEEEVD